MVIHIPLSKRGKNAGIYEAIVSDEDKDLAILRWTVFFSTTKKSYTPYAYRKQDRKTTLIHRVVFERILERSLVEGEEIDHINMNGLDNRRENLRLASHSQNGTNKKLQSNNKSGYKGVFWNTQKGKWQAKIKKDGKNNHIGFFTDKELAYKAYCEKAKELFGEFIHLP